MTKQIDKFILEKSVWTQDDFDIMGWHDANIYGIAIEKSEDNWAANLLLDLDYIFKWVNPMPPAKSFAFWVAPCTLIFKACFDLHIDFKKESGCLELMEIADLHLKSKTEQEPDKYVYEWLIELQGGQISLKSFGFEQIVRQPPKHVNEQVLPLAERRGIDFGRIPCKHEDSDPN